MGTARTRVSAPTKTHHALMVNPGAVAGTAARVAGSPQTDAVSPGIVRVLEASIRSSLGLSGSGKQLDPVGLPPLLLRGSQIRRR